MFFQLGFKAFKQGEGVGSATGKTGDDFAVVEAAHFFGVAFHYGVAKGDLTIAADNYFTVAAYGENSGATILFHCGNAPIRLIKGFLIKGICNTGYLGVVSGKSRVIR